MLVNAKENMICQRRILKEFDDIARDPIPNVKVSCDRSNNNLDWYCMITSLSDENLVGGEYIFHIKLSPRYPFEPPDFYFLTPNGRFNTKTKLCFSNSSHHKETWSPIWNLRTIIMGFLSIFLEKGSTGIGHLVSSDEVIKGFAAQSKMYNETHLQQILTTFK